MAPASPSPKAGLTRSAAPAAEIEAEPDGVVEAPAAELTVALAEVDAGTVLVTTTAVVVGTVLPPTALMVLPGAMGGTGVGIPGEPETKPKEVWEVAGRGCEVTTEGWPVTTPRELV